MKMWQESDPVAHKQNQLSWLRFLVNTWGRFPFS